MNPGNVSEFLKCATKIRDSWFSADDQWGPWFRGRTDSSWELRPKLYRKEFGGTFREARKQNLEDEIREEFIRRAPVLCEALPAAEPQQAEWDWYFMMQHFGAPTRLLDWTEGALIALYFAVRNNAGSNDAAVWVLDPYQLNAKATRKEEIIPPSANGVALADRKLVDPWLPSRFTRMRGLPELPVCIDPTHVTRRITSQHSCFTIHGTDEKSLEKRKVPHPKYGFLVKIVIPRSEVQSIERELRLCGVNEATIFPDLDGLGRSICARWKR